MGKPCERPSTEHGSTPSAPGHPVGDLRYQSRRNGGDPANRCKRRCRCDWLVASRV